MSQPHHDPENPLEQAQATPLPSYESALYLPPDTISFTLARLQSNDRLLILLILFVYSLFVVSKLLFRSLPFFVC